MLLNSDLKAQFMVCIFKAANQHFSDVIWKLVNSVILVNGTALIARLKTVSSSVTLSIRICWLFQNASFNGTLPSTNLRDKMSYFKLRTRDALSSPHMLIAHTGKTARCYPKINTCRYYIRATIPSISSTSNDV